MFLGVLLKLNLGKQAQVIGQGMWENSVGLIRLPSLAKLRIIKNVSVSVMRFVWKREIETA